MHPLKEQRLSRHLSLKDLSERSGVSQHVISRAERSRGRVSDLSAWRISEALGLDPVIFVPILRGEGLSEKESGKRALAG